MDLPRCIPRSREARRLPDLRHGARADDAERGAGANPELADMTRRFWIALALTAPVFALEMGQHLLGLHLLAQPHSNWVQFVLATPVVLWAGWPFFVRGWQSLQTRNLNMFTLIALGVGVAYGYSIAALLAPGLFPAAIRGAHGTAPVYFEAAAVITTLVLLGQVLELRARESTSGAIRALMDLAPKTARRMTADGDEDVPVEDIQPGDLLRVRPGEKIPVDGSSPKVARRSMNRCRRESPVTKEAGASLIAGAPNTTTPFVMRARVGADTLLANRAQVAAQFARADPAPGRSCWPVCAGGDGGGGAGVCRLARRARAAFSYALLAAVCVDHRLPCARGWRRRCRSFRHGARGAGVHQERRGAGTL